MAALDISLAWSVPVSVDILGAHLLAYAKLRPILDTIRLCNRYGRGPQATITKLPAELVVEIEQYLVEEERETQRKSWKTDFACFQGLCNPIDHLTHSEQIGLWYDISAVCDVTCGRCIFCQPAVTKLNDDQRRNLEEYLESLSEDEGPEEASWWIEHENRIARWKGKAGEPHLPGRGLLSTHAALLLRNFGLEVWVTHTQPKEEKRQGLIQAWTDVDACASTAAYLKLPSDHLHDTFQRSYSENYEDEPFRPTENGGGVSVTIPSQLSNTDILRFSRAIKTLGLLPKDSVDCEVKMATSSVSKTDISNGEDEAGLEDGTEDAYTPKLRLLYRHSVDSVW